VKRVAFLLGIAVLVGACSIRIGGTQVIGAPPSYTVHAEFPSTIGLYTGSFVRELGIDVGSVSNVVNQGNHVLVTMKIQDKFHLAPNASAILVGDSVLGERYVQFSPAYVSGPSMPAGTTLGLDRVTVPVETDAVLRSLNTVLRGINPVDIRQFTTNLAAVLNNNGAKLNDLIANAAGTVKLLANKGNDLGQLSSTLARLTGQLDTKDQELANLIRDYDLLSQTIAADSGQLDATITNLTNLTTQGASLLSPDLGAIQQDVADLTTVGQTLDRNVPAIDVGVQYANRLFTAAHNAYDPLHDWLPLNPQTNPAETSAVLGGSVRDALASLCRRLAVKEPALASTLAGCGNPNSGFFDAIIGLIPTLLAQIPGQTGPAGAPATATDAFARGLDAIPGLTPQQRQHLVGLAAVSPPSPATSPGPVGAAAVAALSASPMAAPVSHRHHHRGWFGGLVHWVGGLV
jgi:phospholipid/cholesterol/gamma-HCH transport system substrate-binding protein